METPHYQNTQHPPSATPTPPTRFKPSRIRLSLARTIPLRLHHYHCHGTDYVGVHPVIHVYRGIADVPPPISIQACITHDTSTLNTSQRASLADVLYAELIRVDPCRPVRLDVTFLGEVLHASTPTACAAHYRAARAAHADDICKRLTPSYVSTPSGYAGFLVTVLVAEWKGRGGSGMVYFDCE